MNLLQRIFGKQERALSISDVARQLDDYIMNNFEDYGHIQDLYVDESNNYFAIVATGGALKRLSYRVDNGVV